MPNPHPSDWRNPKLWQLALIGYWIVLLISTHLPAKAPFMPPDNIDKLAHATAFAGLALLLASAWQLATGHLNVSHLVLVWIVVVIYGAIDEWTQILVGRSCSIWDWFADATGAALGLVLFALLRRFLQRRAERDDTAHWTK